MVSLLTAALFLFGTLCLADGKLNCDEIFAFKKYFTKHLDDVGSLIIDLLEKTCNIVDISISIHKIITTTAATTATTTPNAQGRTDNSTTTVKTTTDVVDYDDYKRATLPPQVVASLLG
uniref:Seminal fluid protein HACP014 n=1 Tax=Heliconius erato TaxID=33431 RepID=D9HQ32_HELEA|nr:seminal fluid protein HACP014 [Heliconius erato]